MIRAWTENFSDIIIKASIFAIDYFVKYLEFPKVSTIGLVGVEFLGFEIGVNPRLRIRASARFGHYEVMSYEMNEKIFADHSLNFTSQCL